MHATQSHVNYMSNGFRPLDGPVWHVVDMHTYVYLDELTSCQTVKLISPLFWDISKIYTYTLMFKKIYRRKYSNIGAKCVCQVDMH